MRVPFHQQKNGLPALVLPRDEVLGAAATVSSSIVSIRFLVSGPVFSMVWLPSAVGLGLENAARPKLLSEVCRDPSG